MMATQIATRNGETAAAMTICKTPSHRDAAVMVGGTG
jgi:hypothetical protein